MGTWSDAPREARGAGWAELLGCPFVAQLANRLWVWDPDFGYSLLKIMAFISTRGREKRNCLPWKTAIQKQFPLKFSLRVMKIQSKGGGEKRS